VSMFVETLTRWIKQVRPFQIVVLLAWTISIGIGMGTFWRYENSPGKRADALEQWPADSSIRLQKDGDTLIVMAHPQCPCTRASVGELAEIMAHTQGRLRTYVVFLKPSDQPVGWEKSDLWESAAAIPGVTVVADVDGTEARRFGVATSGQAMLYDAHGRLLFSGGITSSRGHTGDNAGQSAIIALVNGTTADQSETAVFGCPLFDPNSDCRKPGNEIKQHLSDQP
jgi:hypothetical protein